MTSINQQLQLTIEKFIDAGNLTPHDPVDERQLQVPSSNKKKQYFCIYCKNLVKQFGRHLQYVHPSEETVKSFMALETKSKARAEIISQIRKVGSYFHNTQHKLNTGILITSRQQQITSNNTACSYLVCSGCTGSFSKKSFRNHYARCMGSNHVRNSRTATVMGRRAQGYCHRNASDRLRNEIFPSLRDSQGLMVSLIFYDDIIVTMGNHLAEKYVKESSNNLIATKIRYLGKIKKEVIKLGGNQFDQLSTLFNPIHVGYLVTAVKDIAGFIPDTYEYKKPTVAPLLIKLLNYTGRIWQAALLKIYSPETIAQAELVKDFLEACEPELQIINRHSFETTKEDHRIQTRKKGINHPLPVHNLPLPKS